MFLSILLFFSFHQEPTELGYIPISEVHPGQVRYSQKNVELKIATAEKKGFVVKKDGGYLLNHDHSQSLFPPSEAVPVVLSPNGYVIS